MLQIVRFSNSPLNFSAAIEFGATAKIAKNGNLLLAYHRPFSKTANESLRIKVLARKSRRAHIDNFPRLALSS